MIHQGRTLSFVAVLTALLLSGASHAQVRSFYIAPEGDDANPGTEERPFATLHRARDAARAVSGSVPVDVVLREGVYHLPEPLTLYPRDSGTEAAPVTWRAAGGERVLLSGGVPIAGPWREGERGVWWVAVPEAAGGWNFRQLFVDGRRATRARYPNADEANPFLYATGGGLDHVTVDPALVRPGWGAATDAQINMVPAWRFFNQWNTVTGVDAAAGRIDLADSERHGAIRSGDWFWIEGVREELDRPGEWFLDRAEGRLYYMPEPGVDPNTLAIVAPRLNRIVDARGDVEAGTHVEHVHFDGLEFRHTTFTLGHIEARVHTDAAVLFENTRHSSVRNSRFEHIGGYALWLHLDSRRNVFDRNTVRHAGGGGVLLTGARFSYMDDTKVYTPGEAAAGVAPILNEITRNTVEHAGKIRYYGGGVHLDSRPFEMAMSPGNYIAHNHFNDLSRNGIFAFRNQGGNVMEYNHIHNVMQTTVDGACIHVATMNHLNAPNYILNNWLYDIWGYEQQPDGEPERHLANGVFLDWDTSNTTVHDNYVYNAGGEPIKVIWENRNVAQSGNRTSETRIVPPFADEVGPAGTATHGIVLERNRLTGGVIHYTDGAFVERTGEWREERLVGMAGLFEFDLLKAAKEKRAAASFRLPIEESGAYEISLLYTPGEENASNARLAVHHAGGVEEIRWNMREGSRHGFAVAVGTFPFEAGRPAKVVLSNEGADGMVIVDSVAFVKKDDFVKVE